MSQPLVLYGVGAIRLGRTMLYAVYVSAHMLDIGLITYANRYIL